MVAFVPFPARLVADSLHNIGAERVAVTVQVYGLTLLAIRVLGFALDAHARAPLLGAWRWRSGPGPAKVLPLATGYVIAILIGLVVPEVAVASYFGLAVYLIVPFRQLARLLFQRP